MSSVTRRLCQGVSSDQLSIKTYPKNVDGHPCSLKPCTLPVDVGGAGPHDLVSLHVACCAVRPQGAKVIVQHIA